MFGRLYMELSQLDQAQPLILKGISLRRSATIFCGWFGRKLLNLGRFYMNQGQPTVQKLI